jgi:cation diffusion facilitator family transporter
VTCRFDELIPEKFPSAAAAINREGPVGAGKTMSNLRSYSRIALISVLVNFFIMGLKYVLGEMSGSLALKADAVHSFADVISAFAIFLGIIISDRKTKTFPEGLYKVENLVALLSSLFILYAAFEIGSDALQSHSLGELAYIPQVVGGILLIMAVAFAFSRYELRIGLEVGSPSLVADAKHIYADLLSTTVILFSIIGTRLGYSLDRYVAIFVALLVARAGIGILIEAVKVLLDATLDHQTLHEIRKIMETHPDVAEVTSVSGRSSGRYKSIEISLRMHTRLLREAHEIVSHLEEEILDRWPEIDKIVIHYEPLQKETWHVAAPIEVADGSEPSRNAKLAEHFGEAPYFAVLSKNTRTGQVLVESYLENPFRGDERQKGVKAAELVANSGVDEVITRANLEGKGSGYALEALQISHSVTSAQTLPELTAHLAKEA